MDKNVGKICYNNLYWSINSFKKKILIYICDSQQMTSAIKKYHKITSLTNFKTKIKNRRNIYVFFPRAYKKTTVVANKNSSA